MVTYLAVTPVVHGHGTLDTRIHQTPLYFPSKTTTDMDTLKRISITGAVAMQHTAIIIMVRRLGADMIFTLLTTQIVTIILTLTIALTTVHTLVITCGQEIEIFVQMR